MHVVISMWFVLLAALVCYLGSLPYVHAALNNPVECSQNLNTTEYDALHSFYDSTNGPFWCVGDSRPWHFPSFINAPCIENWTGVTCTCVGNDQYSIARLTLANFCLNGTLISDIDQLTSLNSIEVTQNLMYGTIPSEIANLEYLQNILMDNNQFEGTLPESISKMESLFRFSAADNYFVGTIPSFFGKFKYLAVLILSNNYFTGMFIHIFRQYLASVNDSEYVGSILSSLVTCTNLLQLSLSGNMITSSIPSDLNNLIMMQKLSLSRNLLTGTLPSMKGMPYLGTFEVAENSIYGNLSFINDLDVLKSLDISYNYFDGEVVVGVTNQFFKTLYASFNLLEGQIPVSMWDKLSAVNLAYNYLTGPLTIISDTIVISELNVSTNLLTGRLPLGLNYYTCASLDLSNNLFSGPIDKVIYNMSYAIVINFGNNLLSGSLPSYCFQNLKYVQSLILNNNRFTSTIPYTISNMIYLLNLYLFSNSFTGTIPKEIGNMRQLSFLSVANNDLTGTLPNLHRCTQLLQCLVEQNRMVGNPFIAFNYSTQLNLQSINIASNLFSGTIPSYIFNFPKLTAIASTTNCFSGSLPDVCGLPATSSLTLLALDGISSNTNCKQNLNLNNFHLKFVNSKFQANMFGGQIPECIMQMPLLETLHLSGNRLTGTIPSIAADSILSDLSLSNNALTGSIPSSIQTHVFYRLDLSSNKLDGTLQSDFVISSGQVLLTLSINRLSGDLPSSVTSSSSYVDMQTLNILSNNIFNCKNNDLPSRDPYSVSYTCGSFTFILSSSIWCGIFGLIVFLVFCMYRFWDWFESNIDMAHIDKSDISNFSIYKRIQYWAISIHYVSKLWWICAHVENKPIDEIERTKINTWSYVYLYRYLMPRNNISVYKRNLDMNIDNSLHNPLLINSETGPMSFVSSSVSSLETIGLMPELWQKIYETKAFMIVLYLVQLFTLSIGVILVLVLLPVYIGLDSSNSIVTYDYGYIVSMAYLHGITPAIFCGLVIFVIFLFLTPILSHVESILVKNIGKADNRDLSVFSENLDVHMIKYTVMFVLHMINIVVTITINELYVSAVANQNISRDELFALQISLSAFKIIWNGMYIQWCVTQFPKYLSLSRTMENHLIMVLTNFIIAPVFASLTSDQSCFYYIFVQNPAVTTSALLSFCTLFIIDVSDPSKSECSGYASTAFSTSYYPPFQYSYACGSSLLVTYIPVYMYGYIFSGLFMPFARFILSTNPILMKIYSHCMYALKLQTHQRNDNELTYSIIYIKGRSIIVRLVMHLTVLLTFGIACPVLGLAIVLTIINDGTIWKFLTGRYLAISTWIQKHQTMVNDDAVCSEIFILEEENRDAWWGIFYCYFIFIWTTCMFWSLLFFDMIADQYGLLNGMTTTLCYGLIVPFIILSLKYMCSHHENTKKFLSRLFSKLDAHMDEVLRRTEPVHMNISDEKHIAKDGNSVRMISIES